MFSFASQSPPFVRVKILKEFIHVYEIDLEFMVSRSNPWLIVDDQEAFTIYEMIEKLQTELCHPFSISLMQTREKLLKVGPFLAICTLRYFPLVNMF